MAKMEGVRNTSVNIAESDLAALREIEKLNGAKPAVQIRLAVAQYVERWRAAHKKGAAA